ncbi:hypothetical protein Fot_19673 [Forsythia ovata]|uniref:Uncharacterized protein n=1 Tax=Forsythia ovata TaxID=205694 RepID=A0ABD1VM26_9LAMI
MRQASPSSEGFVSFAASISNFGDSLARHTSTTSNFYPTPSSTSHINVRWRRERRLRLQLEEIRRNQKRMMRSYMYQTLENKKHVYGKKSSWSYRLNGFPLSLQLWAYEIIACLNGKFCTMIGEAYPRMLKWETDVHVIDPQLEDEMFKFSKFVATNEEKIRYMLRDCFLQSRQSTNVVEDHNPKGKGVNFDKSNNEKIDHGEQILRYKIFDDVGSRVKDVEVGREVQFDRKGKRAQVDKTNNESGTEFEGFDDEPNANDIELDDMEFTEHDLKMIDECVQMRNLSTSKNKEDVDADDDYILVDDSTPNIPMKRLGKTAAVFRSPYTSKFGSSKKSKAIVREIKTGTYALSDELNTVAINDVVDFEEWYIPGFSKKNK